MVVLTISTTKLFLAEISLGHYNFHRWTSKSAENYSVNLVLSDTYPISKGMLPASTSNLSAIWIVRTDSGKMLRAFSKKYCNTIKEIVSGLPNNVETINLYSTINPKHSLWIANNVFKMAGRSQVKVLKVYPQPNKNGNWNFAEKGIAIYDEQ